MINCGLTVVVFFCFGLDLVPETLAGCVLLFSVGCEIESHSSGGKCMFSSRGSRIRV
jgi:hypothetical protein